MAVDLRPQGVPIKPIYNDHVSTCDLAGEAGHVLHFSMMPGGTPRLCDAADGGRPTGGKCQL